MISAPPKPHGILFAAEMVRAIGNTKVGVWPAEPIGPGKPFKSQTRRIIKPQPPSEIVEALRDDVGGFHWYDGEGVRDAIRCPHPIGTELWVRKTWANTIPAVSMQSGPVGDRWIKYAADCRAPAMRFHWRSPIHMPHWASRYSLIVKDVRVERRNAISQADAVAEGFGNPDEFLDYVKKMKRHMADENPWVWVYEFMRTK